MSHRRWATLVVVSLLASLAGVLGAGTFTRAAAASTIEVNVRDFGATGDGVTNDTAAIQRANDAVAKTGGGRVYFPPGTYIGAGIVQDSEIEFYGPVDAILKHPNGTTPSSIVTNRVFSTTGSIMKGSRTLQATSTAHVVAGAIVAIRGAGAYVPGQTTGTPYLYAKVQSISGKSVLLARSAGLTVSGAAVSIGSMNMAIRGLTLDGNKPSATASAFMSPVQYVQARGAVVSGSVIRNGQNGAVKLDRGTTDSIVENNVLTANGVPSSRLGAAVWIFRAGVDNIIRNNVISGSSYLGIALDDRTQTATDWDGAPSGNLIEGNQIDFAPVDWNVAIYLSGTTGNTIRDNTVKNVQTGIQVDKSIQGSVRRDSTGNAVTGNSLSYHSFGVKVSGSSNTFTSNTITSTKTPVQNTGTRNTFS